MAKDAVRKIKDCDQAYAKYYLEVGKYWKRQLSVFGDTYKVNKVYPREIKLNKPTSLGDECFECSSNPPALWSGIDYFPVVMIELGA
jgi:hypothetical protein